MIIFNLRKCVDNNQSFWIIIIKMIEEIESDEISMNQQNLNWIHFESDFIEFWKNFLVDSIDMILIFMVAIYVVLICLEIKLMIVGKVSVIFGLVNVSFFFISFLLFLHFNNE